MDANLSDRIQAVDKNPEGFLSGQSRNSHERRIARALSELTVAIFPTMIHDLTSTPSFIGLNDLRTFQC